MDFLTQAISWIGDFITTCLMAVVLPFISLLPDSSDTTNIWFPSYPNTTFNVASLFYLDWMVWAVGIFITVALICLFVNVVRFVISVVHDVADSLPIIG